MSLTDINEAPTAVSLADTVSSLAEGSDTSSRVKVADITVIDDALGSNTITLVGDDADYFEVDGTSLYLKAGTSLDFEGKAAYDVTVSVSDVALGSTPVTTDFSLSLTDANDAATFGGDLSGEVTEGAGATVADALTITGRTATANDEDASDADGFQGGSYIGTYGTLTMQANGQWAYTVDKQFAAIDALLPTSAPLLDTVQVRAADGTPTDIVITIRGANDTPVAVDDGVPTAAFVSVNEDSGFTVIDVLANDTDAEGHAGLVVASASSTHGTVNIAPDGKSISFRPTADYFGPAAITYTVRDGNGTVSDAATVRVEVTALIDPAIVVNSVRVGGDLFINGTDDDATTLEVTGRIDGTAGSDFTVGQTVRVTTTDGMTHDGEVLDASGNFLVNVATASLIYRAPDADSAVDRELVVALMNPAGTTVAASLPVHYIVDTQAPSVDLMAASTTLNPSTGVVENNDTIAGSTVTLFFSADDTIEGTFVNVLQVYNHGVLLGNARLVATPDGTGNYWRYVASGLTTGDYSFTAVGTDMAGNRSDHSSAFTISVDRTAPVTAASDSASLYENSSLLYSVRNTDDAGDPVTWSLVPDVGDAGRLFLADRIEGGVVVGKEVRVSAGAVDYDNTTDFQTSYTFTLRGADALGNSTDKTVTIQVLDAAEFSVSDVTVGNDANPIVNAADLSGDHVRVTARLSGEFAGLGTGTAGEPIFFLSVGPDGDYLTGDDAACTFDPSTGIVTFTHVPSALIQAHAELLVHAMVPVDHVGTTFDTSFQADTQHTYAVDTVAPGLEMLRFEDADGVNLLAATGPITVYRDAVDLAGLIGRPVQEATSRLAVWDNGVLVAQPAFDPGVGDWRLQLTDLTPGLHEVSVVFTDLAGNATTFTRSFTYEPDVAAPVITSPGTVNVTENNTFSHALAATDATRVSWQVMEVEGQQGSLFTVADGNRLVLKDGMPDYETRTTYTVTVRATDTSNNFVDQTISIHVGNEVESTSITSVAVTDAANVINLAEAALAGTPGATLAVSGHVTGEYRADDEVQVVANGTTYTGHVVAGGSFTVNVNAADLVASTLPDAAGGTAPGVTVTVQATGSDGTVAPVSVPQTFTFDTSVPTVTLDDLPDTVATRTVAVAGTVSGAAAGATVTVQVLNSADEVVATGTGTVAAGTGRFSADVTGLSGGDYHVVARVDNPAGNTGRSDPEPFEYSGFFIEASGPYGFATTMDENVAGYGVVLSARSDANPVGAEPTLAIEGGADASLFELVRSVPGDESSPWVLQFKPGVFGSGVTLPDYDVFAGADGTPADGGDNTFEVVVQATDALGAQVQQTITLALLDRGPVVLAMGGSAGDTSPLSQTDTDGFRMFTVRPNDSRTGNAADIAWANPQNQQAGWARKGEASDPDFPAYVESIPSSVEQTGAITADDGQGGSEVLLTMGTPSGFDGFRLTVALNPDAWAYRSLSAGQERVEHVDLWMAETGSDPLHAGEVSRLRTTWTIVGVNDAPEAHNATASVAAGVHENQATPVNLTYAQLLAVVGGTDVDGADDLAALRVVSVGLGTLRVDGTDYAAGSTLANLRITPTSTVQWVPGAANDANGPQTAFTVRAVDAAGLESADATVRVDLAADDDAPVVTGDRTGSISEDAAPTSGTRLQTTGVLTLTDVDGPPPTFDMGRTYEGNYGSLTFATDPASGGLRWTYTLNAAADRLVAAESVVDTIPVTLTSDVGQVFDIQVTVTGANDGPTIVATLKSDTIEPGGTNNGTRTGNTQSGNFLTGTYVGDVETGLTGLSITRIESVSADGSTTFGSAATPGITGTTLVGTYGAMVMSSTGAWTYTAGGLSANPAQPSGGTYLAKDEKASDYFRVTVTDPQGGHTTSIIQCEVTGRNDQPNLAFTPNATYASIDSPYVAGGGTVQLASAANFVDPDGLTQIRSLVLYSASEWDWNNDALVVNLPGTLATNFRVTQTGAEGIAAKGLTVEFVDTADRTAATNPPTNAEWAQVMQSIGFQSAEGGVAGERVFFFQVFDVEGSSRSISSAFVSIHVEATVSVGAEAPPEAAQPAPDGAGTEAGAGEPGTPAGTSGPGTSTPTDIDGLLAALASTDPAPADAASGPGTEPVYPDPFHYWRTPDSALLMV